MRIPKGRWNPAAVTTLALLTVVLMAVPGGGISATGGGATPLPAASIAHSRAPVLVAGGYVPGPKVHTLGALPGATELTILVGLPSRDPSGFAAYETAAYVPGTGAYREFLSPSQLASRFGPGPSTVAAAQSYFSGYGLHSSLSPDGLLLTVSGPSSSVARSFGTSFEEYRTGDGRVFFSHPSAAHLPASVPTSGVYGLGDVSQARPAAFSIPSASAPIRPAATCTTGPAGLSPCQIWGAYDTASLIGNGTNGTGERIAVVDTYDAGETETQLSSDLSGFDSLFALPTPSVSFNYPVATTQDLNSTYTGWGLEEALDLEWTHASAPGASLVMTFAPNSGVGLYLAVDWLVSHHLTDVISLSWGEPDVGIYNAYNGACTSQCNASSDGSYEVLGPLLEAAAVEGIGVFVATGDCGSADGTSGVSSDYPSSDPSAVAVGGTYLSVSDSGVYQGEVAWSGNSSGQSAPGCQNQGGSGGGYSPFPRPYWQSGSGLPSNPATRGVPDVSADASNGVTIVQGGGEGGVGGTSLSTPIWAGFAAIADQHAGRALGDLNPGLYTVLRASNYSVDFHDITSGNNGYSAGTGWDPVTGIGSPDVGLLVKDLAEPPSSVSSLRVLLFSDKTYGNAPLSVRFAVTASGGTGHYPLEGVYFGEGNSSLASNGVVSHTFPRAGVYAAVAFAVDSGGNLTTSDPVAVVVGGGGPLNVTLTPSSRTPAVGAGLTFTTAVTGGTAPYGYYYSFGDGTFLNLSLASSVVHSYAAAGGFCAAVVAQDSANPIDGARSSPVAIAVGGASAPTCSNASAPFTVSASAAPPVRDAPADFPSLFQVSGGVSGAGGAGINETLSSSDPYVSACQCTIFRAQGIFPVRLTAVDLIGDVASNETNVTVAPALDALFTATPTYGSVPLTVQFHVNVSGGYLANANDTQWAFGDGTTAGGASVNHTFTSAGLYSATGDTTDRGQGNASEGFLIDVLPPTGSPPPALTATFAPAVNVSSGTTVHFSAQTFYANGANAPASISWSLGENATAWGPIAAQTYYRVSSGPLDSLYATVTAHWADGSTATDATLLTPQLFASEAGGFQPDASALHLQSSGGPLAGNIGLVWSGIAHASGPGSASVGWTFGDGASAAGPAANHTFSTSGNFSVNVTAGDAPWNDTAVAVFGVQVAPGEGAPLVVTGGPSVLTGAAPLDVTFGANATGGTSPYVYAWVTGDGSSSPAALFHHAYAAPGTYTASLTVHDAAGRSAESNWTITVSAATTPATTGGASPFALYVVVGGLVAGLAAVSAALLVRRRSPTTP